MGEIGDGTYRPGALARRLTSTRFAAKAIASSWSAKNEWEFDECAASGPATFSRAASIGVTS
jgi:hypothetical protein